MKSRSDYNITDFEPGVSITIEDLDGPVSVTNDAENVVRDLLMQYGNIRIFYYDTMGNRDELCHSNGKFTHFAPARI